MWLQSGKLQLLELLIVLQITVDKWEPLLNNLGHVCRKLK